MRSSEDIQVALQANVDSFTGKPSSNAAIRERVDPLVEAMLLAWENNKPTCRTAWQRVVSVCSGAMFDSRLSIEERSEWQRELEYQIHQVRVLSLQAITGGKLLLVDLDDLAQELPEG
jgi:hypothetical protein